ncbi:HNH endonuclease [Desulfovibrio intestinalis]|uniref:HNH endonuclease n=1 Tax=Desulfovibrio intestinalis TaxID=58621 RepID=A0A7W8C1I2_9BACT|nr:HNH endonuclease [Desulfovibrio intestinalis]MBB5143113.1 hypothetical protein [Desulfovibrio intestinalis]
MADNRKYPQQDVKILYGKAAARCAFSKCRKVLVLEDAFSGKAKQIGKIAHIVAHSPSGPRADQSYPQDKLDRYVNWVLLCPTCHDIVDTQPEKYSTEVLLKIKQEHESWVEEQLDEEMSNVSFAELEVAAKALSSGNFCGSTDFHVIPPELKITKNKLTQLSRSYILMGLSRSSEVERFLVSMAQLDSEFPERLKNRFKEEYLELCKVSSGDELFMDMLAFANSGVSDFKQQAARLAIVSHLFHLCEIFKK